MQVGTSNAEKLLVKELEAEIERLEDENADLQEENEEIAAEKDLL